MIVSRISLALASVLMAGAAWAQAEGSFPRSLAPETTAPAEPVLPSAPSGPTVLQGAPSVLGGGGGVTVGDLGTAEGPAAGTLGDADGLGYSAWDGSDRSAVVSTLERMSAAAPSPLALTLLRKVLLTAAPPPPGRSEVSFNALRIRKLLEMGMVSEAADIASKVRAQDEPTQRAQADALLYAGRDGEACGEATTTRLNSAEKFWAELRAYCIALSGDPAALEFTLTVMRTQGVADEAFFTLLDGVANNAPKAPDSLPEPNALLIRMMARLNLALDERLAEVLGAPIAVMIISSADYPAEMRWRLGQNLFTAGLLPVPMMRDLLALPRFDSRDLVGAPALARSEPFAMALARLAAGMKMETAPDRRAELVHTAFVVGERDNMLPLVAKIFAEEAVAIVPAPDWSNWAPLMIRALLLADRPDAALRWFAVLDRNSRAARARAEESQLIVDFFAPDPARAEDVEELLEDLADEADEEDAPPEFAAHAALVFGMYDVFARPLPEDAREAMAPLTARVLPGRRPAPILMQRIEQASSSGRRGETSLLVLDAIGPNGPPGIAPDVSVRLARALLAVGLDDEARRYAKEALLTRPLTVAPP